MDKKEEFLTIFRELEEETNEEDDELDEIKFSFEQEVSAISIIGTIIFLFITFIKPLTFK